MKKFLLFLFIYLISIGYSKIETNSLVVGGTGQFGGVVSPIASDGTSLGSTSIMWSDLFLANGGVINFNNGNYTMTHSAGNLALNGNILLSESNSFLGMATADGADNKIIFITGGGAADATRGSQIIVAGNESALTGRLYLDAGNVDGGDIIFRTEASDAKMTILKAGNIGIGVAAPAEKLEVAGTVSASALVVNGIVDDILIPNISTSSITNIGIKNINWIKQQFCQGSATAFATYTTSDAHGEGDNAFTGGVLAPNGKVILVPAYSDYVGIYDPVANTYTTSNAHGEGNGAFYGGVLAPNGKVILVPNNSDYVGVYDPVANTYTTSNAHGEGDSAFYGGVLAPNGKVILVPLNSDYVGVYDPVANTYTRGVAHGEGDTAFYGGVLAPNGKVILVPLNSDYVGVYDPVANTYTTSNAHGEGAGAFTGGVLAPDGKVILVPNNSDYVGVYDPVANTYTRGVAHGEGDSAFRGGVLAPNGKVILVPSNSDYVGIYDPVANTYTRGVAHGEGDDAFTGGVLAPNGKVILAPAYSDYVGIYDELFGSMPTSTCINPYFNKL